MLYSDIHQLLAAQGHPAFDPFRRLVFRQGACARVVKHDVADAPGAQLRKDAVKTPAAIAESFRVSHVAQRDDAIADTGQIRPNVLQGLVELFRIVRYIALAIGRSADQEQSAIGEDAGIQFVHQQRRNPHPFAIQPQLDLLRHKLGNAGHGADQDREL